MSASSKSFSSRLEAFLRPLTQSTLAYKPATAISPKDLGLDRPFRRFPELNLGLDQVAQLGEGHPIRYGGEDGSAWTHGCLTPGGAHLRHLEPALEEAYLALEKAELARPPALRYHHVAVTELDDEFLRVDLEALRRHGGGSRENNAMERAVEEGSKKGSFLVGSAEGYIDEFVLPVVGGASPTEAQAAGLEGQEGEVVAKTTIDELERLLSEARKVAEEKEGLLRQVIKKNRRVLGCAD